MIGTEDRFHVAIEMWYADFRYDLNP